MRLAVLLLSGLALGCGAHLPGPARESPDPDLADAAGLELRARGASLFETRGCAACHTIGSGTMVGPDLSAVTERREPDWVAAMIQRPDSMLEWDPVARDVGSAYAAIMPRLGIAPDEARALVAFLADPAAPPPGDAPACRGCPGWAGSRGPGGGHRHGARRGSPHGCLPYDPTRASAFVPTDGASGGL